MLKKTYTFTDYNGMERTEDFYFNLSEAEVLELEIGEVGGFSAMINRIMAAKDFPTIVKTFKDLIKKSYGVKSPDGREFIKNDEVYTSFVQCEAYSKLFIELATVEGAAAEFVNGIMPSKMDLSEVNK